MGLHSPWRPPKDHGGPWPWPQTFLEMRLCQRHWLPGTATPTGRETISSFSAPIRSRASRLEWALKCWGQCGDCVRGGESRDSCDCRGWGATGKEPSAGTLHTLPGA